jgi:hypothetical protein
MTGFCEERTPLTGWPLVRDGHPGTYALDQRPRVSGSCGTVLAFVCYLTGN